MCKKCIYTERRYIGITSQKNLKATFYKVTILTIFNYRVKYTTFWLIRSTLSQLHLMQNSGKFSKHTTWNIFINGI